MARKLIVPSAEDVSKKWGDVTPGRAAYYESETPKADATWEANTKAAKPNYKAAIADPKIADRFGGGVSGKAAKFKRKVVDVGVARFSPGVTAAIPDMKDGVDPYLGVLGTITVPDRKPRGDPSNYRILDAIGDPLHKKRLALLGATAS